MSPADPKPRPRIKDPKAFSLFHQAEHRCRVCGGAPISAHHLVPRSRGGDDLYPGNLVPLCGDGTRGCHSDVEHYKSSARYRLRATLTDLEINYVVKKRGQPWLDRQYPIDERQVQTSETRSSAHLLQRSGAAKNPLPLKGRSGETRRLAG